MYKKYMEKCDKILLDKNKVLWYNVGTTNEGRQQAMISTYAIKKAISEMSDYGISEDGEYIINRETNKPIVSVADFVESERKEKHCDFESLYYEEGTLLNVLKCRECGTVIFASDDVNDYDAKLCCPVCGNYHTYFEYWTKEAIEADIKKQNTLNWFEEVKDHRRKDAERYKRTGCRFNELYQKRMYNFKKAKMYVFTLTCNDVIRQDYSRMQLTISVSERLDKDIYNRKKTISIPLSFKALKDKIDMIKYKRSNKQ